MTPATQLIWKYKDNAKYSEQLLEICGSKVVAQLLANRNITCPDEAKEFLNISEEQLSSPFEFEDMPKVIERVNQAIQKDEHILIYGDFDADGITGTSILYKTLKHIGANVSYYVPERVSEGHGISTASILKLISTRKARLIITNDCGISNANEITLAKNFNVDVIITDHHELPEVIPRAYAIINPKLLIPDSKMAYLCGAGVSYKVSQALLEHFDKSDYLKEIIHLAAIGTIADLVPLKYENRVIAQLGIDNIINYKPLAIEELAKVASIKLDENFSSETIAFHIAPRLNAIGRLSDATIAVKLLTTEDPEVAKTLAKKVDTFNRQRKDLCESTFQEACVMLSNTDLDNQKAIVLAHKDWHPGVIGIVASQLVEKYYRPTFLMAIQGDMVRGSSRSIKGVHLFNVLSRVKELFTQYGGHEMAAGFNFTKDNLDKFKISIINEVNKYLENIIPQPELDIEMDINLNDLELNLVNDINKLAPFGIDNPSPILSASDIKVLGHKVMGANENHMKMFIKSSSNVPIEAIWWQHNSLDFDKSIPVNIAFSPEINTFMDKSKLQLIIKDLKLPGADKCFEFTKNNEIQWIDLRTKSDITQLFNNLFKLYDPDIAIFAENKQLIDLIKIKCPIIDRLSNNNYKHLILFEYPSEESILKEVINNIQPETVYLSPQKHYKVLNEAEIVKTVLLMLKYAKNNKNSEANLNHMAAKLGTNLRVITLSIDVLVASKLLQIISFKDNILKFKLEEFSNVDLSTIKEMQKLNNELSKGYSYRKTLLKKPVKEFNLI